MILIDECHLVPSKASGTYRAFLDDMLVINPAVKIIGFSASPYRLGSGLLTEGKDRLFTDVAYEAEILPLIEQGFLAPLVTTPTVTALDVSGVGVSGGDYKQGELERAVDVDATTAAAVSEIVALGADRRSWIVFCAGVDHSLHVAAAIRGHGISCGTITGETEKGERARLLAEFKAGRLRCLTNNNVLTTGINVRGIDLIAFLRPTKSTALYVQMAGRGMRISPETGKTDCLVLDFARLIENFGPVDRVKPKPKGNGLAPTKKCPECEEYVFASARVCPNCRNEFPPPEPAEDDRLTRKAADAAILSSQVVRPQPEWVRVDSVSYGRHAKPEGVPSMVVTYRCGFLWHREWICMQHVGYARQKAVAWWGKRSDVPAPETVDEAIQFSGRLRVPSEIQVMPDGKYVRIVGYRFAE